jgi:hypothetical protein
MTVWNPCLEPFCIPKSSARPFLLSLVRVKLAIGNLGSIGAAMISATGRKRLTYAAMSLFLAWHTLALIVAPAPLNSTIVQQLRVPLQPYLSLFRLDNPWNFFAPYTGNLNMSQFRYAVEDKAGQKHGFMPEAELSKSGRAYFWFRGWYTEIANLPDDYADIAAAHFCKKHASLDPVSVTLLEIQENDFTRADFLAGKGRWDPEFVTEKTIKSVPCPAS